MKIISRNNETVIQEVFSGILMETKEGNAIGVCMRDDTLEINVLPKGDKKGQWYRINMQSKTIDVMNAQNIFRENRFDNAIV